MKGNLLIVEDEPKLLEVLKYKLEELADETFSALNGLEALEVLKNQAVHCILCDINMPKLNGVELLKRVREVGNEVSFIFYSGHGNRELMLEVSKYGAFDFLEKPSFDGLEEVVSRGLHVGLNPGESHAKVNDQFISDYKKLLASLG